MHVIITIIGNGAIEFSRYSLFRSIREIRTAARRLSHANISRSIVSAQRQRDSFVFQTPRSILGHISRRVASRYTPPLLSFPFSNILIMEQDR